MGKTKLPDGVCIKSIEALNDAISSGNRSFAVILGGGLCFSRKTITKRGSKYRVVNHIDESIQVLSEKELLDEKNSIIGEAMEKEAFYTRSY